MNNNKYELEFADILANFGIDYNINNRNTFKQITEENPNFEVITNIIKHNMQALTQCYDKGSCYVFGTVKNIIASSYWYEKKMWLASQQRKQDKIDLLEELIYDTVVQALFDLNIAPEKPISSSPNNASTTSTSINMNAHEQDVHSYPFKKTDVWD